MTECAKEYIERKKNKVQKSTDEIKKIKTKSRLSELFVLISIFKFNKKQILKK